MSYVTDVAIINRDKGERAPDGFHAVLRTPNGHNANLHKRSLFGNEVYLCFDCNNMGSEVICDLAIVAIEREAVPSGFVAVTTTPKGHSANLNKKSGSKRLLLCYKKKNRTEPGPGVVDMCVIIPSKGERVPAGYTAIERDVNDGSFGADSTYICYKKEDLGSFGQEKPPMPPRQASRGFLQPGSGRPAVGNGVALPGHAPATILPPQYLDSNFDTSNPQNINIANKAQKRSSLIYENLESVPICVEGRPVEAEGGRREETGPVGLPSVPTQEALMNKYSYSFDTERFVLGK
eukprot:Nk52_evm19s16 gene=Nk52_evmTU19s16